MISSPCGRARLRDLRSSVPCDAMQRPGRLDGDERANQSLPRVRSDRHADQRATNTLKPPHEMRPQSNGNFLMSQNFSMRLSCIAAALTRSRWARDL